MSSVVCSFGNTTSAAGARSEHEMSFFKSLGDGAAKKKDDKKKESSWKGGSSDMDALKKKSNGAPQRAIPDKARLGKAKQGSTNFFDKVGKDINQSLGKIDLFNNNSKKTTGSRGGGQSLGGDKPGIVMSVSLENAGPLGLEVEKRKNVHKTAIIAKVMPGSQAELAGLKRGDIVCHPGSNGSEEIMYDQFIAAAKSGRRPLRFDVRRIESSILGPSAGSGRVSADAESRRHAVIAAAEARNNKHKALQKPIPKTDRKQANGVNGAVESHRGDDSEETRRAVAKVKQAEKLDAAKLGYDPYAAQAMTSGQARTAQVAMASGEINADNAPAKLSGGGAAPDSAPGIVSKPAVPLPAEFEESFGLFVTSNSDHAGVVKSLGIMRKLINNAVTKGQDGDEDTSSKFRRVRLSNPKIHESISAKAGAVELMILFGFQLSESDGETYLAFPSGYNGPEWTASALEKMQTYENG